MLRGLPSGCCSALGSTGPWAGFSLISCWACSNCSCGSAIASNMTSSVAGSTWRHIIRGKKKYNKHLTSKVHKIPRINWGCRLNSGNTGQTGILERSYQSLERHEATGQTGIANQSDWLPEPRPAWATAGGEALCSRRRRS